METTIQVYENDRLWWKTCCKKKKLSSKELFKEFRLHVKLKKQREFYLSLEMPSDFHKPLLNVKIRKNYKKI